MTYRNPILFDPIASVAFILEDDHLRHHERWKMTTWCKACCVGLWRQRWSPRDGHVAFEFEQSTDAAQFQQVFG